jgi:hypothetical protein
MHSTLPNHFLKYIHIFCQRSIEMLPSRQIARLAANLRGLTTSAPACATSFAHVPEAAKGLCDLFALLA